MARHASALQYAVRIPVVLKYYGQCLLVLAGLMVPPLAVCLLYREWRMALWLAAVVLGFSGSGVLLNRLHGRPRRIRPNEALTTIGLAFFTGPLFLALPLSAGGLSYVDGLFEAVSGCTTTGLTVLRDVDSASQSMLFLRAWMQWFGGLGISILSVALITAPGLVARSLAGTLDDDDLVGSTRARARLLCLVFTVLTVVVCVAIALSGLSFFEAVLYAMTAVSTGGFSSRSSSIADIGPAAQTAVIVGCLAGALPLAVYGRLASPAWENPLNRRQAAGLLLAALVLSALLSWTLASDSAMRPGEAGRHGVLLAISAQTTAGFSSLTVGHLSALSKALLLPAMFVGGCVGSTAGGIKILRALVLFKVIRSRLRKSGLARHAVERMRLGGHTVCEDDVHAATALLSLYVLALTAGWLLLLAYDLPPLDSLFDMVSALGTVGLSTGVTGPDLPTVPKLVLCAGMWLGRLEIIAWLVLLSPKTWFGNRTEVP